MSTLKRLNENGLWEYIQVTGQDVSQLTSQLAEKVTKTDLDNTNKRTKGITDPRELGAVGDGINDDTLAIQGWLNDGKLNKTLRDGVFRITSGLVSSVVGRTIRTEGATILADGTDITALTITGDKTKVHVDIDGNSKSAIGVLVQAAKCHVKKCNIENIYGTNTAANAIRVETSSGVSVTDNEITNVSAKGNATFGDNAGASRAIVVTSTTAATSKNIVKNNIISGITGEEGDAIQFLFYDGSTLPFLDSQGVIQGNFIKNANRRAIKIQASNVKVIDNTHMNTLTATDAPNAVAVINVIQSNNVTVKGNEMDASLFVGISVTGTSTSRVSKCVIEDNVVRGGSTQVGIYFDYLDNSTIEDNTIYDGSHGISGSNSNSVSVSANTLYGGISTTTGYGINSVGTNVGMVINNNKSPSGQRLYMINNLSPDADVQGNYGNCSTILIQTSSTATGSCYKDNVNAGTGVVVTGTSTGQTLDGNINM
jgi:parallel beta-helix repeat protein